MPKWNARNLEVLKELLLQQGKRMADPTPAYKAVDYLNAKTLPGRTPPPPTDGLGPKLLPASTGAATAAGLVGGAEEAEAGPRSRALKEALRGILYHGTTNAPKVIEEGFKPNTLSKNQSAVYFTDRPTYANEYTKRENDLIHGGLKPGKGSAVMLNKFDPSARVKVLRTYSGDIDDIGLTAHINPWQAQKLRDEGFDAVTTMPKKWMVESPKDSYGYSGLGDAELAVINPDKIRPAFEKGALAAALGLGAYGASEADAASPAQYLLKGLPVPKGYKGMQDTIGKLVKEVLPERILNLRGSEGWPEQVTKERVTHLLDNLPQNFTPEDLARHLGQRPKAGPTPEFLPPPKPGQSTMDVFREFNLDYPQHPLTDVEARDYLKYYHTFVSDLGRFGEKGEAIKKWAGIPALAGAVLFGNDESQASPLGTISKETLAKATKMLNNPRTEDSFYNLVGKQIRGMEVIDVRKNPKNDWRYVILEDAQGQRHQFPMTKDYLNVLNGAHGTQTYLEQFEAHGKEGKNYQALKSLTKREAQRESGPIPENSVRDFKTFNKGQAQMAHEIDPSLLNDYVYVRTDPKAPMLYMPRPYAEQLEQTGHLKIVGEGPRFK